MEAADAAEIKEAAQEQGEEQIEEEAAPVSEDPEQESAEPEEEPAPKGVPSERSAEIRRKQELAQVRQELAYLRDQNAFFQSEIEKKKEPKDDRPDDDLATLAEVKALKAEIHALKAGQGNFTANLEKQFFQKVDQDGTGRFGDEYGEIASVVGQEIARERQNMRGVSPTLDLIRKARDPAKLVMALGRDMIGVDEAPAPTGRNRKIAANDKEPKTMQGVKTGSGKVVDSYEAIVGGSQEEYNDALKRLGPKKIAQLRDEYEKKQRK